MVYTLCNRAGQATRKMFSPDSGDLHSETVAPVPASESYIMQLFSLSCSRASSSLTLTYDVF